LEWSGDHFANKTQENCPKADKETSRSVSASSVGVSPCMGVRHTPIKRLGFCPINATYLLLNSDEYGNLTIAQKDTTKSRTGATNITNT
jgi:hypothetical protein